ncbi:MAG: type II secretion system F family protein [Acidobacteria bacterium]|nr:type II secretion system F family protein [Acidobacteriota bacterium]MDA1233798.1 type II secretion system F family protein [Acidobacteriota bacterium]
MMSSTTITIFFASLAIYGLAGYWFWVRRSATALAGPTSESDAAGTGEGQDRPEMSPLLNALANLGQKAATQDAHGTTLRRRLERAGFRQSWAPEIYHGARLALVVGLPSMTFALITLASGAAVGAIPATALGAYLGLTAPGRYLDRLARRRTVRIGRSLPDFLDLLVVSVESGLSLDQAVADTARDLRRAHRELSEELAIFSREVQAGASRADALRNLGTRTGDPEMRKLTSILIQADRFGSSVSKVLRNQARYMRIKRRQRAEESAHKVGVKLIFPIFFLIMPSVLLVTAGPAVIMLLENFSRMVNEI